MSKSAHLTALYEWRDNIVAQLKTLDREDLGGLPDSGGPLAVGHMGYRAQLLSELQTVEELIDKLEREGVTEDGEESAAVWNETRGAY